MKTIQEMAREAGAIHIHERPKEFAIVGNEAITRFAALAREEAIAEANAKANASWTRMCEKMVVREREECAELVYNSPPSDEYESPLKAVYDAIKARSEK